MSANNFFKKTAYIHDSVSTSFHEAGHTIYGLLHYMYISSVCVIDNKKSNKYGIEGFTDYFFYEPQDVRDKFLKNKISKILVGFRYAGFIVEKQHFKNISGSDKLPLFIKSMSSSDMSEAATIIRKYKLIRPKQKLLPVKKRYFKEISKELSDNWEDVSLISHHLFKKKRLNFADLKRLLTTKSSNKEFWKEQFRVIMFLHKHIDTISEEYLLLLWRKPPQ